MPGADHTRLETTGIWLAIASFLMIVVFLLHGPLAPDLDDQMVRIAESRLRWLVAHWIAAGALSSFAVAGFVALSGDSRLIADPWSLSAWAVIPVGALWTTVTAVAEATVISDAAASGATETFRTWWAFAEGQGSGFAILALGVAVIAVQEARRPGRAGSAWPAWIGAAAGATSFVGWALGSWIGVPAGNLLWVASSIAMCAWLLWFGVGLAGTRAATFRR